MRDIARISILAWVIVNACNQTVYSTTEYSTSSAPYFLDSSVGSRGWTDQSDDSIVNNSQVVDNSGKAPVDMVASDLVPPREAKNRQVIASRDQEYEESLFPQLKLQNGYDEVSYMLTHEAYTNELMIHKKVGHIQEGIWQQNAVIDTITNIAYYLAAQSDGNMVAVVYADDRSYLTDGQGGNYDLDVYYRLSNDQGLTWQYKVNITNYTSDSLTRATDQLAAMISDDGELHIIWVARILWDSSTYSYSICQLFHWSSNNPRARLIAEARYDLQYPCREVLDNLLMQKVSLSDCENRLYVLWVQYGFPSRTTNCSVSGFPNGELYLSASEDEGFTWDLPTNLAGSFSPSCDSGICDNISWASIAPRGMPYSNLDSLDIIYLDDKDAGDVTLGQGSWTLNPIMYLRTPCRGIAYSPRISLNPDQIAPDIQPSYQLDTLLSLKNYGNVTTHWSASVSYIDGYNWLSLSPSSGILNPDYDNIQNINVSINSNGELAEPGTVWNANIIVSSDALSSPDTIPVQVFIRDDGEEPCDSCDTGPTIASCCDKPGDANNDGSANVGDAVYLINYVFKGGSSPPCMAEGDANNDLGVNIGDAVALISYIFKGGSAPICNPAWPISTVIITNTKVPKGYFNPSDMGGSASGAVDDSYSIANFLRMPENKSDKLGVQAFNVTGRQVGATTYDCQHIGPVPQCITYHPVNNLIHMVWTGQSNNSDPGNRRIYYQAYDPATGNLYHQVSGREVTWSYSGSASCVAYDNGTAGFACQIREPWPYYSAMAFYDYEAGIGIFQSGDATIIDEIVFESGDIWFTNAYKGTVDNLKVAKMENAFQGAPPAIKPDFVDIDIDRFRIETSGSGRVFISTECRNKYHNDNTTQISPLKSGGSIYQSDWQLLVSGNVDDDYAVDGIADDAVGDKTHKILPNGNVVGVYINDAGQKHVIKIPVPGESNLIVKEVFPIILRIGGKPCIPEYQAQNLLDIVRERYAQVGVTIRFNEIGIADAPNGVDLSDGVTVAVGSSRSVDAEAKALIAGLGTANNNKDIHIYFVNELHWPADSMDLLHGVAIAPYWFNIPQEQGYLNNVIVAPCRIKPYTLSHELGHLWTNAGHDSMRWNLMYPRTDTSGNISITNTKRLAVSQEASIRATLNTLPTNWADQADIGGGVLQAVLDNSDIAFDNGVVPSLDDVRDLLPYGDDYLDEKIFINLKRIAAFGEKAFPPLCDLLLEAEDEVIASRILGLFCVIEGDKSIPRTAVRNLIEASSNPAITAVAINALGHFAEVADTSLFYEYIKSEDYSIQMAVLSALSKCGDSNSVARIESFIAGRVNRLSKAEIESDVVISSGVKAIAKIKDRLADVKDR